MYKPERLPQLPDSVSPVVAVPATASVGAPIRLIGGSSRSGGGAVAGNLFDGVVSLQDAKNLVLVSEVHLPSTIVGVVRAFLPVDRLDILHNPRSEALVPSEGHHDAVGLGHDLGLGTVVNLRSLRLCSNLDM